MSRYNRRTTATNNNDMFRKHFEVRDVVNISLYRTPLFVYPTDDEAASISLHSHPWSRGDKFYLLSSRYYGDPKLWWVIAQYNQKPTEQHAVEGQIIKIPFPITALLQYI